jgi:hypothetical protein
MVINNPKIPRRFDFEFWMKNSTEVGNRLLAQESGLRIGLDNGEI